MPAIQILSTSLCFSLVWIICIDQPVIFQLLSNEGVKSPCHCRVRRPQKSSIQDSMIFDAAKDIDNQK